jgi:uncharacterized protein YdeI (YjbR/CyaY-like superfamily)
MTVVTENFEMVHVASAVELHGWLSEHYGQRSSVWLVTFKKDHSSIIGTFVSRDEVLDELVSFGWIDGIRRKLDDDRTMQLIGPRQVQHWSKSYKLRAARLIDSGRMHPAGLAAIESSKATGLWDFMDDVDALIAPDDLLATLDARPPARANYEAFPPSTRRNTLRWIKIAKTQATRRRRIERTAELAAQNQRVPNA